MFGGTHGLSMTPTDGAGNNTGSRGSSKARAMMGMSLSPSGQNIMMGDTPGADDRRDMSKESNAMTDRDGIMTDG